MPLYTESFFTAFGCLGSGFTTQHQKHVMQEQLADDDDDDILMSAKIKHLINSLFVLNEVFPALLVRYI